MRTAIVSIILLVGCGGNFMPSGKYANNPKIDELIDIIESAGPDWEIYATKARNLQRIGRIYVAKLRKPYVGWAFYGLLPEHIIIDPDFLYSDNYNNFTKASILIHELTHIIYKTGSHQLCEKKEKNFLSHVSDLTDYVSGCACDA